GFELRKLLRRDSYFSLIQAYTYAGLISSGPWILSIISMLVIGIFSIPVVIPAYLVTQFQTAITYLIASSLTLTGFIQLGFTRYCADRIFARERNRIIPNFNGIIFVVTTVSGGIAFPFAIYFFTGETMLFRLLFASTFVALCNVWMAAILLSGLKAYKAILLNFLLGYGTALILSLFLRYWNLEGLLFSFLAGQFVLFMGMLRTIFTGYPSASFIEFDFLRSGKMYKSLLFTGLFYNLGIWADKFVFWFHPDTSINVIGPLRASEIYDLPIFMAYLAIIPGMAVFLTRMETDFVEYYQKFYDAVREGGTLEYIFEMKDEMVRMAREGIYDIIKIQAIAAMVVILAGPALLRKAGIPEIHMPLLTVDVVGASFQVVFLGILNIYFYLDKRGRALFLTGLFAL